MAAFGILHHHHHLSSGQLQPRIKTFSPRAQQPPQVQAYPIAGQEELLRTGAVRSLRPREAAAAMEAEGFRLLDARPPWEHEKAHVGGSIHVALYVEDTDMSPVTLLKKWVHFGYIGLWTGQYLTTINDQFLPQVEALVPNKEDKLLVACGEGLRSLIALRVLHKGGYKNLAWLVGGFNRSMDSDFPDVQGSTKLQFATIGGVSYIFLHLLLLLQVVGKEK